MIESTDIWYTGLYPLMLHNGMKRMVKTGGWKTTNNMHINLYNVVKCYKKTGVEKPMSSKVYFVAENIRSLFFI